MIILMPIVAILLATVLSVLLGGFDMLTHTVIITVLLVIAFGGIIAEEGLKDMLSDNAGRVLLIFMVAVASLDIPLWLITIQNL